MRVDLSSEPTVSARRRWAQARNLLLVRVDNLGDVLMTTPAIHACTALGRRLTLLASRSGAALHEHLVDLDDTIACDPPWVQGPQQDERADRRLIATLARRRFDAAIIFTVCTQSALPAAMLCRLAGIPLRLAHVRENPYALLSDHVRDTESVRDGMRHEVDRQLDLVGSVGYEARDKRLRFQSRPAEVRSARCRLAAAGIDPTAPYAFFHVGSSAASRRYPPERFGIAARRIRDACGMQIVFCGGPDEQALVSAAQRAMGEDSVAVSESLSLGELAAMISDAQIVVCNNSGPAHLAAACRTPVVVAYAQTNPQHTPWQVPSRVLKCEVQCRHCLKSACPLPAHPCLTGIDAASVADAALDLLDSLQASATRAPVRVDCEQIA
jgi:ADP-heptose:LPS heptosyltransferase